MNPMNKITLEVDTTPGTTKDVTITCGDQCVTCNIPDEVLLGVDGTKPDPRKLLVDVMAHLGQALAQLAVKSVYSKDKDPTQTRAVSRAADTQPSPSADWALGITEKDCDK
jgi:hypothetical protein